MMCEHLHFEANVNINRITRGEGGPVGGFMAEIRVKCCECGEPFQFIGAPMGMIWDGPAVSPNGQELRVPIRPSTMFAEMGEPLPGFLFHLKANA